MIHWHQVTHQPDTLGESPFWHPQEHKLYWVDIARQLVQRLDPATGAQEQWLVPAEPGCIAPARDGGLVMALRDGVYRADRWQGPLQLLAAAPYDASTSRFNDGKCDALGRLWAGSMFEPRTAPKGALYSLSNTGKGMGSFQQRADGVTVANGLAWSPDNRTVYWADTSRHQVRRWQWDVLTGEMGQEAVFHQFPSKPAGWNADDPTRGAYGGRPDGAAVDEAGHYFVAMYEGQCITRLSAQGEVLQVIPTPVRCPTMPCFGGPDRRTLYITSSRHGRSEAELREQPQAGCVFSMRMDVPGLPVNFFGDAALI